ncbi:protein-glutamate O-methyltransferase [Marivita sp.]|uniref:CheR family methyltransferase n=1 Tax=Marivita sp. TaxID=2003365 RepID=UPI0025B8AF60|nr:protein-glutamate O-methyltransferase [Marivita sp.]
MIETRTTPAQESSFDGPGAISMSQADFQRIAGRVQEDYGIHLPQAKKDLVYSRLLRRVRFHGFVDFGTYCDHVESVAGVPERTEMLSALTTNVTHFFREKHHFDLLSSSVLPPLLDAARRGGRVRLWSAGCSSGQEAYSLALTVLALCPDAARYDIRILATDIDPKIVARAQEAVYPAAERAAIGEPLLSRFTESEPEGDSFRIAASARALVTFATLNLIGEWPVRGPFDVIMCRNVAIYFGDAAQHRLWQRFTSFMQPGAHLFIGHSERIVGPAEARLENVGITAYRVLQQRDGTGQRPDTKGATK